MEGIIRFYMLANILKNKIRTGWVEVGIEKERLESVAEHIYGTLILAIAIDGKYELNLDMVKVLKTLVLHETEEMLMPDYTLRADITKEEKIEKGKKCVHDATLGLLNQEEIETLLDEFNNRSTKEAKFCYLIDKIECDFQAKMYDLEGVMDYFKTREDLDYYGARASEIDKKSKTASDFWIEYDRPKYDNDDIFKTLIEDIKNIDDNKYKNIIKEKDKYI